ncbi:MAG: YcjX family protein [Bauldia sp.]|nr:YcjX family protein [Bauldia sp.]
MARLTTIADETRIALANLADRAASVRGGTVRLGVTGLSRAGKTVFITALVHNLIHGGRLPLFRAYSSGRVIGAELQPQPDDAVPRFAYEDHVKALVDDRIWPESTRRISELRITIAYESATFIGRRLGRGRLHVDIVDYPGEWLLDLPLLAKDFATWSAEATARAAASGAPAAKAWLARIGAVSADAPEDETLARELAALFTEHLRESRDDRQALSTLPPGRFLMPGDLEGSPALTFSPLTGGVGAGSPEGSLFRMMARRYEAYKAAVVRPFFREHFTRLDRQIVLVDALQALNAGPAALADLENALTEILACFRPGRGNWLSRFLSRRIDRILLAATKADHLHHGDHDRLEAILKRLLARAVERASISGAGVDVLALASVRATKEGTVLEGHEKLPSIIGTPIDGETINGDIFDGATEIALFPGDLPDDPEAVFGVLDEPRSVQKGLAAPLRFVRFRPPPLERTAEGYTLSLPHIRLDRALDYLIGDRLA